MTEITPEVDVEVTFFSPDEPILTPPAVQLPPSQGFPTVPVNDEVPDPLVITPVVVLIVPPVLSTKTLVPENCAPLLKSCEIMEPWLDCNSTIPPDELKI